MPNKQVTPDPQPETGGARERAVRVFDYAMTAAQPHLTMFIHAENHPHEIEQIAQEFDAYAATKGAELEQRLAEMERREAYCKAHHMEPGD